MNVQGNLYTFIFSTVMVLVVAGSLAFTATKLKPAYKKNIEMEKKQNILQSIDIECSREDAVNLYKEHIKKSYVLDYNGEPIPNEVAFDINMTKLSKLLMEIGELRDELKTTENEDDKKSLQKTIDEKSKNLKLPIYEAEKDKKKYYIIPVMGKGLWGPIWGYVALESDFNTVFGTTFDHKAETPGLGAEITTSEFENQFKGKKIFDELNNFVSVSIVKGGIDPDNLMHEVDAISGGTITSDKLENTIYNCIIAYEPYFKK